MFKSYTLIQPVYVNIWEDRDFHFVQQDKVGIERGRKTIAIYKSLSVPKEKNKSDGGMIFPNVTACFMVHHNPYHPKFSWFGFCCCNKHYNQSNSRRSGLIASYTYRQQSVTEGRQGGTWKQELKERSRRIIAHSCDQAHL